MRILLFLLAWASIFSFGCTDDSQSSKSVSTDSIPSESLYPYPQYIQEQIAYVDTTPLGIEMVAYENGVLQDSGFISREKFKELAKEFTEPDPNKLPLRNQYEENSFQDLSLNTITFSITAKDPQLPLREANILLDPDNHSVKYVLLKKEMQDSGVWKKKNLMWVNNMNFQISTTITDEAGNEETRLLKVIWDKPMN